MKQGNGLVWTLVIAAVVIIIVFLFVSQPPPKTCTEEALQCPDGSYVGRNPLRNCAFDPCPTPTTTTSIISQYPIEIVSVNLIPTNPKVGDLIYFNVSFKNIGNNAIYIVRGCGSALYIDFVDKESVEKGGQPRCLCAVQLSKFDPGETEYAEGPNCADGVTYKIVKPGIITANLTIQWSNFQFDIDSFTSFLYDFTVI